MITVKQVLNYRSFKDATLVTGEGGLENEVNGVMVMEAADIESWGRKGLLILTSYFAMENVSLEKIDLFFRHAKRLGIGGFVVKVDRLVQVIPPIFVASCEKYQIPLIQIDKKTPYEKIISEILETMINRNAYLLQNYYDIHKRFSQLMMEQPDIPKILETLKSLIHKPITLQEKIKERMVGTDPQLHPFQVHKQTYLDKRQQLNLQFQENAVTYLHYHPEESFAQLSIAVPNLGYEEYELIIHKLGGEVDDLDFMAIENTVAALQIELVKRYAIRQSNRSRQNEMVSDLLHGRLNHQEDIDDTIHRVNLDPNRRYRIILFHFHTTDEGQKDSSLLLNRFTDTLINLSRTEFPERVYVTRQQKVILIAPTDNFSLSDSKKKVQLILDRMMKNVLYQHFFHHTTFSNEVSVHDLAEGYRQATDTQKILQLTQNAPAIASYKDIGIYQIFVETDNLDDLNRFIPDHLWILKNESPELLETLRTFIDVNQNYSETAQRLFVHPKTVRYRITGLRENYNIHFDDPEEMLRLSIGLRLLHLLPAFSKQTTKPIGGTHHEK